MGDYTAPSTNNIYTNLSQGSYTPKDWRGSTFDIGLTAFTLNQIWTDDNYVYAATSNGTDIYQVVSEKKYAYIEYTGGFNTVWGNDEKIFFGTSDNGVKYINKSDITGNIITPVSLVGMMESLYITPYELTSMDIKYIHGNDKTLMVVTSSGIDTIKYGFQGYHSSTMVSGGTKCFLASNKRCYYILNQGGSWSLNRVDNYLGDWVAPDKRYMPGSGTFNANITFNDIYVTEGTSTDGSNNVLFVATSSGVYVVDEGTGLYRMYDFISGSTVGVYSILKSLTNNFTAVWADPSAGLESGRFYVSSSSSFSVVDAEEPNVYDWYTQTHEGRGDEVLDSNDSVDISVGG